MNINSGKLLGAFGEKERRARADAIFRVVTQMVNMPVVECGDLGRIARNKKLTSLVKLYCSLVDLSEEQ